MGPRVPGVRSPSRPAAGLALRRPPPTSAGLIQRDRVLAALAATADARALCLQEPGGYGKTTAVSQWLDRDGRPIVWVRVPRAAPDAAWVAQAIVDGLHQARLAFERLTLTGSPGPTTWHLSTLPLIESLLAGISQPFVLVVDDAGAVAGTAWDCLVESLAVGLPKGAQVVLTTRGGLPTPIWRLQSRGEAAVLGREVMAFDAAEARALMAALGVGPTDDQVQALMRQTEGWHLGRLPGRATAADPGPLGEDHEKARRVRRARCSACGREEPGKGRSSASHRSGRRPRDRRPARPPVPGTAARTASVRLERSRRSG